MKNTGIYVTGFNAYGGKTANSSEALVLILKKIFKDQIDVKILPTSYSRSKSELETIFSKNPKVLLMFGYSKSAKGLKLEILARNNISSRLPDNDGHILSGEVVLGGPIKIHTGIDLEKLIDKAGSVSYLSHNAGGYLCNYAYYLALYNKVPTIFIHVPRIIDERIVSGAKNIVQSFLV